MKALAKKLMEVQKEVPIVTKDTVNPFFKSKYADINSYIEVVKPILNKHGIVLLQPLDHINGTPAIKTILIDSESGETLESVTPIPQNTDPQKQGSTVTYFRRYALQSALFLQAEDDDANVASGKVQKKKPDGKHHLETEDDAFATNDDDLDL